MTLWYCWTLPDEGQLSPGAALWSETWTCILLHVRRPRTRVPTLHVIQWLVQSAGRVSWTWLTIATAAVLRSLPVNLILNFLFWPSAVYILFTGQSLFPPHCQQPSGQMSPRCKPMRSALVSASWHIHEDLRGYDRGSLRCLVKFFPGIFNTDCPHPHSLLLNSTPDHQVALKTLWVTMGFSYLRIFLAQVGSP